MASGSSKKTKLEVLDRKKIFGRNHKNYRHYNLLFLLLLLWLWLWVAYRHPQTRYHASLLIVLRPPPIKQVYLHQIKFLTSPPFYLRGIKMNIVLAFSTSWAVDVVQPVRHGHVTLKTGRSWVRILTKAAFYFSYFLADFIS